MVFSMTDNKKERYELAKGRICEIGEECVKGDAYSLYFRKTASFLQDIVQTYEEAQSGELYKATMETLQEKNRKLYEDILPENYEESYGNPVYAVKALGEGYGQLLSFLYTELRSMISFCQNAFLQGKAVFLQPS